MFEVLVSAVSLLIFLSACASQTYVIPDSVNEQTYCPVNSNASDAGKVFIVSDPFAGYFSAERDKWPWDDSVMKRLPSVQPRLKLVCIAPIVTSKGLKQRPVVYVPVEGSDKFYVFGATDAFGKPAGVVDEDKVRKAQALVGKTLWFTSSVAGEMYERLDNLTPYKVASIELGKSGVCQDILMVVQHSGRPAKIPVMQSPDGNFKLCYGKKMYEREPSPTELGIKPFEYEAIKNKQVQPGMSEDALLLTFGVPDRVNRTVTQNRLMKQYIYNHRYVYVENGIVTTVQD